MRTVSQSCDTHIVLIQIECAARSQQAAAGSILPSPWTSVTAFIMRSFAATSPTLRV